jgi:thioredoxin-like negative regulator of GroEL
VDVAVTVGKIDLSQKIDVAKEFGIMGTSTTVLMSNNKIVGIFVGIKKRIF